MKKDEPMRNINPFGLRIQPALRSQLEEAAAQNKRSLNAEISARLEESFAADTAVTTTLIPAGEASKISASARKDIAVQVRHEIVWRLNEAIRQGLTEIGIDLARFALMLDESKAASDIASSVDKELKAAGYKTDWDGTSSLCVSLPPLKSGFPESLLSPSKRKPRS